MIFTHSMCFFVDKSTFCSAECKIYTLTVYCALLHHLKLTTRINKGNTFRNIFKIFKIKFTKILDFLTQYLFETFFLLIWCYYIIIKKYLRSMFHLILSNNKILQDARGIWADMNI